MTLEEAKDILSFVYTEYADKSAECACKYNDFETANYFDDRCKAIDIVLKALEDGIPKEKVRELIRSYTHDMELCDDTDMFEVVESEMYEYGIDMLKELLGE